MGVSGDTAVVSGQDLDDADTLAYVFERVAGSWVLSDVLSVPFSTIQISDLLSVAIEGDTILVGEGWARITHVFERMGGGWTLTQTLQPAGASSSTSFGTSASLRDGRAIIGGAETIGGMTSVGTAWVFERQGGVFVEAAQLVTTGGHTDDRAGAAIAQTDDTIVLGAPTHDLDLGTHDRVGAAFVFERQASAWVQTALVTGPGPRNGDSFASAIALQGDVLLIGAPRRDDAGHDAGALYRFHRTGSSWLLTDRFLATAPVAHGLFGGSLALEGDTLLIGAPSSSALDPGSVTVMRGMPGLDDWNTQWGALAGTHGAPCRFGDGPAAVGDPASLVLTGASPHAAGWLVLGLSRLNTPFSGGVLVPSPDVLLPLQTDAAGEHSAGWSWPVGAPLGTTVWSQHWIIDSGGPSGWAASNALRVAAP